MVQLRVARFGLKDLPLVDDSKGTFYFKGEGDSTIWLSPHDEIPTDPCDAAPEEIDIATAIDRFEQVVDWPIERVERSWAGLRSFAPDRLPVYGFDPNAPGFFWCAGQGGFGIQTSPAAAKMAAAVLLEEQPEPMVAAIDPRVFSPARFAR
jgi:D-arginine dehydrogenase